MGDHRWLAVGTAEMTEQKALEWSTLDGTTEASLAVMFTQVVCLICDMSYLDVGEICSGLVDGPMLAPHRWVSLMTLPMTSEDAAKWADPDVGLETDVRPQSINLVCTLCGQTRGQADEACPERQFWLTGPEIEVVVPLEDRSVKEWETLLGDLYPRGVELQIVRRTTRGEATLTVRVPTIHVDDVREGTPYVTIWPMASEEPIPLTPSSDQGVLPAQAVVELWVDRYFIRANPGLGERLYALVHFQVETPGRVGPPDGVFWQGPSGAIACHLLDDFKMGDGASSAPDWLIAWKGEPGQARAMFITMSEHAPYFDSWEEYDFVDTDPRDFLECLRAFYETPD